VPEQAGNRGTARLKGKCFNPRPCARATRDRSRRRGWRRCFNPRPCARGDCLDQRISDVSIKRKIRNYVADAREGQEGHAIYVTENAILNDQHGKA
jgi:hypothetical protein